MQDCHSWKKEHDIDDHSAADLSMVQYNHYNVDDPYYEAGSKTLDECKTACDEALATYGVPCVAIEWNDNGVELGSNERRDCHVVKRCDYMGSDNAQSVYLKITGIQYVMPFSLTLCPSPRH